MLWCEHSYATCSPMMHGDCSALLALSPLLFAMGVGSMLSASCCCVAGWYVLLPPQLLLLLLLQLLLLP